MSAYAAVAAAVASSLGAPQDEVTRDASLFADLGAGWVDFLEIILRIERAIGIRIYAADLEDHLLGGLPTHVFADREGYVSAAGLAHLQRIGLRPRGRRLHTDDIVELLTVGTLADFVASRELPLAA